MTAERYFVCIDIGGTFIKHGLADRGGHIYKKGELPTEIKKKGVEGLLKKVAMIVASYRYEHKIAGVAISTPGVVDAALGEIIFAGVNFPGYTGTRLRAEIEARTGLPCAVQNDVKCVGLAESWIGAGSGAHSVFCMAVGTGIGGSLILDGRVISGTGGSAGEIGFIELNSTGASLEASASTAQLVREVAELKGLAPDEISGRLIFKWAKEGDEIAIQAINLIVARLAEGIATVQYVFDPECVILGGGIMAQEEYLRGRLEAALDRIMTNPLRTHVRLEFAKLKNDAGMLGALCHLLQTHPELNEVSK